MAQSTPAPPANAAEQSTALAKLPESLYLPLIRLFLGHDMHASLPRSGKRRVAASENERVSWDQRHQPSPLPCNCALVRRKWENTETSFAQGPPSGGCSLRRSGAAPVWATVEDPHYVPLSRARRLVLQRRRRSSRCWWGSDERIGRLL